MENVWNELYGFDLKKKKVNCKNYTLTIKSIVKLDHLKEIKNDHKNIVYCKHRKSKSPL